MHDETAQRLPVRFGFPVEQSFVQGDGKFGQAA